MCSVHAIVRRRTLSPATRRGRRVPPRSRAARCPRSWTARRARPRPPRPWPRCTAFQSVWKSTSAPGAPSWLGQVVRNEHHHAIEQASRRWRGGRRTRRKILISTQVRTSSRRRSGSQRSSESSSRSSSSASPTFGQVTNTRLWRRPRPKSGSSASAERRGAREKDTSRSAGQPLASAPAPASRSVAPSSRTCARIKSSRRLQHGRIVAKK